MKIDLVYFYKKYQPLILPNLFYYSLSLPLILLSFNQGRAFEDQHNFHLPTINHFIEIFDLTNYHAAMTPGYHIVLAALGIIFSSNEMVLKIFSSFFTALLFSLISKRLCKYYGNIKTLLLMFPMLISIYIFPSGVWLLPDNLSWLIVFVTFAVATKSLLSGTDFLFLGLLLVAAILVRQPYLWLASTIWTAAFAAFLEQKYTLDRAIKYLCIAIITTLPAFVILYGFYQLWEGLVPPSFQKSHQSISYSLPPFFLSTLFFYCIFFLPLILSMHKKIKKEFNVNLIIIGATIGFFLSIFPETNYNQDLGRFSGIWNFVKLLPTYHDRSFLIIILSTLGGALLFFMTSLFPSREKWVISISTLAFVISMMFNKYVYERYIAGYIFIYLYILLSSINTSYSCKKEHLLFIGPVLFAIFNGAVLLRGLW